MKRLGLLIFVAGAAVGYLYPAYFDRFHPGYIDRREAIEYGRAITRRRCAEMEYIEPYDCRQFRLCAGKEDVYGWDLEYASTADARRVNAMWLGRRGEYEWTNGTIMDGWVGDRFGDHESWRISLEQWKRAVAESCR